MRSARLHPAVLVAPALVAPALVFWPSFLLLTIVEQGVTLPEWLRSDNRRLWLPVAVATLVSAMLAPLFSRLGRREKFLTAAAAVPAYAATYVLCAAIGVTFFSWDD